MGSGRVFACRNLEMQAQRPARGEAVPTTQPDETTADAKLEGRVVAVPPRLVTGQTARDDVEAGARGAIEAALEARWRAVAVRVVAPRSPYVTGVPVCEHVVTPQQVEAAKILWPGPGPEVRVGQVTQLPVAPLEVGQVGVVAIRRVLCATLGQAAAPEGRAAPHAAAPPPRVRRGPLLAVRLRTVGLPRCALPDAATVRVRSHLRGVVPPSGPLSL